MKDTLIWLAASVCGLIVTADLLNSLQQEAEGQVTTIRQFTCFFIGLIVACLMKVLFDHIFSNK